jgi:hypothetical protein
MTAAYMQRRWDRASQHRAFQGGLGLLDPAPVLTLDVLLALHAVLMPQSNPCRGRFRDSPIQIRFDGVTHRQPPTAAEAVERTTPTLDRITLEMSDAGEVSS